MRDRITVAQQGVSRSDRWFRATGKEALKEKGASTES
jgi:hypothetical protein